MTVLPQSVISIQVPVVSAKQMQEIESCLFANGMPVAALMEKVGGLIARRIQALYPLERFQTVGVLVGPGHNGADALVVARELSFKGYQVRVYQPFERSKDLTTAHAQFARSLSIPFHPSIEELRSCDVIIDGLFGFGLERSIEGDLAHAIRELNQWSAPIVSIDVPSGLHTDTGEVLGVSVRATHTLCLGLWKLGLLQDTALEWVGQTELIDFDIPWPIIESVLGIPIPVQRLVKQQMLKQLPLVRDRTTHKYKQGHLLLVGGSQTYPGSIILAGLGARASGVGMLSIAVPMSLKSLIVARLLDAVVIGCDETEQGAIAQLPENLDLDRFDAIAYGPGVTTESVAVLERVLGCDRPLILDADGLNLLASLGVEQLHYRSALTVLTPHTGEFRRLLPQLADVSAIVAAQQAARGSNAIVVLKGACTAIAAPNGQIWINAESTPALARGGSGDVLTGLMGGLVAQAQRQGRSLEGAVQGAVWWHSAAGCWAAQQYTVMGVNAETLAMSLQSSLVFALG
ncbi:MAG: NAD(P)H-hydrate dehydratase [Acaryochloridaceae cyanobacterium RU_4_10]|nr:NAD(P)H-hydrate dehydratase [Acaryochloridaceae cyanobacterium RU_4_10]